MQTKPPTAKEIAQVIGFVIGLALLIWAIFTSFTVVGVGQVNVITRLGNVNREVGSGIHWKLPFAFEKNNKFDIKTQRDEAQAGAASQDLQDVGVTVVTNYHIEPGQVDDLFRTVGIDYKARIIDPAVQESVKASTAKFPIGELITRRAEVKELALKAIQSRLEFRGIKVEDISFTNFEFSTAYKAAITQKQVAEQQAQQAKFTAEKAANDAQAAINQAQGQAEAQRLLTQTASDKSVELKRLEVQSAAIAKWNGQMPTTVAGDSGLLFNIPVK